MQAKRCRKLRSKPNRLLRLSFHAAEETFNGHPVIASVEPFNQEVEGLLRCRDSSYGKSGVDPATLLGDDLQLFDWTVRADMQGQKMSPARTAITSLLRHASNNCSTTPSCDVEYRLPDGELTERVPE